ncbi:MAG TPA: DUF4157 domain-containing protein [Terriglobales bacterium]|nr:DUF4157 domain-containing protein [Terriglobales bacterium]
MEKFGPKPSVEPSASGSHLRPQRSEPPSPFRELSSIAFQSRDQNGRLAPDNGSWPGRIVSSHPVIRLQRAVGNRATGCWLDSHLLQAKRHTHNLGDIGEREAHHAAEPVMQLQRTCACGGECDECRKKKRLGVQAKLTVGEPGDIYEQEADRTADQVMAAPAQSLISGAPPRIQRVAGPATVQADAAPASVDQALASPGKPLEPELRQDMEQRFGRDFSGVRVHADTAAAQSARDVNAKAYTVGNDLVFGAGLFAPETHEGRRLLAHELTHAVQQGASSSEESASAAEPAPQGYVARQPLNLDLLCSPSPFLSTSQEPLPPAEWLRCYRAGKNPDPESIVRFADSGEIVTTRTLTNWALRTNLPVRQLVARVMSSKEFSGGQSARGDAAAALALQLREIGYEEKRQAVIEAQMQQEESVWRERGEKFAPSPNATLLTKEQAAAAETEGKASKPYKEWDAGRAQNAVFRYGDTSPSGRFTVIVPNKGIIKMNVEGGTYYYSVPVTDMYELTQGLTAISEEVWESTKGINVVYGYVNVAVGKVAGFGPALGRLMGPTLETAGQGMLYDVRKTEARLAGREFNEPAPEIGIPTLVEGAASAVAGPIGGKVEKVTGSAFIGNYAGAYAGDIINKGYQAIQGERSWGSVFAPPNPVDVAEGYVESKVAGHLTERWTKGKSPRYTPEAKAAPAPHPETGGKPARTTTPAIDPARFKKPRKDILSVSHPREATARGEPEVLDKAPARRSKHELEVDERGIELCSPKPCPLLHKVYARELKEHEELKTLLDDLSEQRRNDPKNETLRRQSQALEERLGELKARNKIIDSIPEPDLKQRARGILEVGVGLDREQLDAFAEWKAWRRSRADRQRALNDLEKVALGANARRNRQGMTGRVDEDIDRMVEQSITEHPQSAALQYRENLIQRFPRLANADLKPIERNLGEPGLWEESIYTGSGRQSWKAKLPDGTGIQLDDIDNSGVLVDTKMRGISAGREIPPGRVPDVVEQTTGPRKGRQFDAFPESEQTKLLKQLRFSEAYGLNGVRWETNSPELKAAVERYARRFLSGKEQKLVSVVLVQR